mmetsp:Transcript_12849/g.25228  ORF Transcript_12849/g.25228 Transcript_12849/m.25228 type:complete len:250 (+) Transcript_12849:671-1420(+)
MQPLVYCSAKLREVVGPCQLLAKRILEVCLGCHRTAVRSHAIPGPRRNNSSVVLFHCPGSGSCPHRPQGNQHRANSTACEEALTNDQPPADYQLASRVPHRRFECGKELLLLPGPPPTRLPLMGELHKWHHCSPLFLRPCRSPAQRCGSHTNNAAIARWYARATANPGVGPVHPPLALPRNRPSCPTPDGMAVRRPRCPASMPAQSWPALSLCQPVCQRGCCFGLPVATLPRQDLESQSRPCGVHAALQ